MTCPPLPEADALAERFAAIALAAAGPVMEVYARGAHPRVKSDRSPVTDADERAEAVILEALARELAGVPVVSEEAVAREGAPTVGEDFVLVDPLDGTREFLARNGEFTVNIALVRAGAPVCGVIFAPAMRRLWLAGARAFAVDCAAGGMLPARAVWRGIVTRAPDLSPVALVSRSHPDERTRAFLDDLGVGERRAHGSSLKFGLIAEGEADVYPRFGPTMAWDIAAGDAIVRAAGGIVLDEAGKPMRYGPGNGFRNGGFVAWGRAPHVA